mmetsp:Transcript_9509/g.17110  ORF Transcript_9509/g.17110 Transcript_9509/m.17110 type:complete len:201 (+) Transcript_9509:2820-3422(+)
MKAVQVVRKSNKTADPAVQEEDHAVNKKDDRTGSNDEYKSLKQRRSSSITFDIMRESTGSVDSALTESLLSLGRRDSIRRDYGFNASFHSLEDPSISDSDDDNSEDGDISEAIPPSIRSSAPLEIDLLENSLADSSDHSANISDDKSDCSERGSDDANISEDSRLPGRRRSSASSKIKALKNRLTRGSNHKTNRTNGERR